MNEPPHCVPLRLTSYKKVDINMYSHPKCMIEVSAIIMNQIKLI